MKLESVEIDNYRAIEHLRLPLDPSLTVLHGGNTCGKTSVLSAIAVGLGAIPDLLPGVSGIDFLETDLRAGESFVQVDLTMSEDLSWKRERFVGVDSEVPEQGAMALKRCRTSWRGSSVQTVKQPHLPSYPLSLSMTPTGQFSICQRAGALLAGTFLPLQFE